MDFNTKKVFITGGTGFIGSALTEQLVKNGAQIYILTRDTSKKNLPSIHYVFSFADIKQIQPDIIINLAGAPISKRWTARTKQQILASRLNITKQIVDYIILAPNKPQVFISGSAIGYYGTDPTYEFVEESAPHLNGTSFAHEVCAAWEKAASPASAKVRTVLLRIGVVLERNGGMLSKLIPIFRLGLGSIFGNGKQWISWIDRDDLIRVILFAMQNENIQGPLNATAPQPVTNSEFVTELAAALHRSTIFPVPSFLITLMSGQMGEELILNGQKVLPNKLLHSKFMFNYPSLASSLQKIFKNS